MPGLYMPHDLSSRSMFENSRQGERRQIAQIESQQAASQFLAARNENRARFDDRMTEASYRQKSQTLKQDAAVSKANSEQRLRSDNTNLRALDGLSSAVVEFWTRVKAERDSAEKMDFSTKLSGITSDLANNAEKGYKLKLGADAAKSRDFISDHVSQFDAQTQELLNDIDPSVAPWAKAKLAEARADLNVDLVTHYASQVTRYRKESSQSLIDTKIDSISRSYTNPSAIKKSISEIYASANSLGLSDAGALTLARENTGKGVYGAISAALSAKDVAAAKSIFRETRSMMDAQSERRSNELIKSVGVEVQVKSIASNLLQSNNYDYGAAMAFLDKKDLSGEQKKQVAYLMRTELAVVRSGTFEMERKSADMAWKSYNTNGSVDAIDKSLMQSLNPADRIAIYKQAELDLPSSQKRIGQRPGEFVAIMDLAESPSSRDEFLMIDARRFPEWKPEWKRTLLQKQQEMHSSLGSGNGSGDIIERLSLSVGNKKERASFKADAYLAVQSAQEIKGALLTRDEAEVAVGKLFTRSFFGGRNYKPLKGKTRKELYEDLSGR